MLSESEFLKITEEIYRFHTKRAPGIPIGVAMVDLARQHLGPIQGKLNAISETQACLSDVLQVMTGCTMGNRYLRVMKDIGRYALTLFDREDGRGVRVSVDLGKIDPQKTPELYKFFRRERGEEVEKGGEAREASGRLILEEFQRIGRDIFRVQRVRVRQHGKPPMLHAAICPECGESFLQRNEMHRRCDVCAGEAGYYDLVED
ncbi:MAG: Formylmethanofuran dehydrogenase [Candidatus Ozemobacter sibiricus]|jgi:formylmethanofuran dehydrogenase subunit E|uniref:Formylmethanofuran dehydrogenase n=1 Tax=Candidatus Ozemobacter sibiricus TaxID=2268124 RepID=A0A367ZVS0_9BACT|nr:MAG: Formylmethanofuran dehydrogenase [Candidatus Ozemobacter sibiricus]